MGFQQHFTELISTIPSCALCQHILLPCVKWPPEQKIEKSCLDFKGKTAGGISMELHRSDQNHP
jgi:hypothetical protein